MKEVKEAFNLGDETVFVKFASLSKDSAVFVIDTQFGTLSGWAKREDGEIKIKSIPGYLKPYIV